MAGTERKGGSCPVCGNPVDPLRAGAVGIFDGAFVYFCSDACRGTFAGARVKTPAQGVPPSRPLAGEVEAAAVRPAGAVSRPPPGRATPEPVAPPPFVVAEVEAPPAAVREEPSQAFEPLDGERAGVGEATSGEEGVPERAALRLPAYGLQPEPSPVRAGIAAPALFGYLLLLGLFAAANLVRRWFPWVDLPPWLGDAVAATGAGLLVVLSVVDLVWRRGRGVDHLIVGAASGALVLWSVIGGSPVGTPQALAVLAVYSAAVAAERRLLLQRSGPLAPVQGGPRADALCDWGGVRGPLLRGLRLALTLFPLLPAAAALAAATWAGLSGVVAGGDLMVPILVGGALALLPWSLRHAGLVFGELARAGAAVNVRFLDPSAVERAARAHHLVFLYRGVATQGRPEVVEFVNYSDQPDAVILDLVASAEQAAGGSSLAEALLAFTQGRGAVGEATTRLSRFWPGQGVKATSARGEAWIGSRRMLLEEGISTAPVEEDARHYEQAGHTVLFIALRRRVHALVALADPVRPEMAEAVEAAHRLGLETHLVTGESRLTAEHVARSARVRHVRPELAREERAAEIRGLREMGMSVAALGRPAAPAQVIQDADVAIAIDVADPHGFPCEIAAAADDPRTGVACLGGARQAVAAVVLQLVVAGGVALLNAGVSVTGFLPPPATLAVAGAVALVPLLRRRRFRFGPDSGRG